MLVKVRVLCCCLPILLAQTLVGAGEKLIVTVIDRADNTTSYTYVVPGYSSTTTNGNADCYAGGVAVNCQGSSTSSTRTTPASQGRYELRGATLTLQLPDGRMAVVNCESKTNLTDWSMGALRNCRVPMVKTLEAEFDGDKVKLRWRVGINGEKGMSETYKLTGLLEKPEAR